MGPYQKINVKKENFIRDVDRLIEEGYYGLNVTVPLKEDAYKYCDNTSDVAKALKAVNTLITATTVAQDNNIIWKYVDRSKMHMRKLSEDLIKEYLNKIDDNILGLVGVYAIEEEGIKLFENIGSDLFSIQGISLIQLTQFLWDNNLLFENNGT